jgi:outer membrane protein TolC
MMAVIFQFVHRFSKKSMNPIGLLLLTWVAFTTPLMSLAQTTLTLEETLHLAHAQSLDAMRIKNMYLARYWEYRAYRSGLLPQASMTLRPFTFNRQMVQRYDINENIEVFRQQQTLNNFGSISLNQNIGITGGRIFLDTDLNRLVNFGNDKFKTYSATPIRIGFAQPLFAYNDTKWRHQLSPLQYERAKQEYIQHTQDINTRGTTFYFDLVLAMIRKEMAAQQVAAALDLYEIGKKRFEIASISKDELLNLELNQHTAEIDLERSLQEVQRATFQLNAFLGRNDDEPIVLTIPTYPQGLQISIEEAIEHALTRNPNVYGWKVSTLEANRALEQTVRENRLKVDIMASYGLNQQGEQFDRLYTDLLNQELVALNLHIPLLDWGQRRGKKEMALRQKEIVEIEVKQAMVNFEKDLSLKVIEFNLREKIIMRATRADTVALESYELIEKRFKMGQVDVMRLTNAMQARQRARESYIQSLAEYWKSYYALQQITLYDFINQRPIEANFDELIQRY